MDLLLLIGSFAAGILTVLAPCVLPLLPIIIGGSISGNTRDKKRPLVIAASLAVSIIIFTLLLKATTLLINVPPQYFTYISGGIIIILGLATLFPGFYGKTLARLGIEQAAQKALGKGYTSKRELIGPIITGAALGPVFSSCSPVYAYILATVLPVNFGTAFTYIISYTIGLSLVMLAISYYGQRFISKITFVADPRGVFQRSLAIVFIIVGLLIATGFDKKFQTYVSTHTPFNFDSLSERLLPQSANKIDETKLFNVEPYDAPEFTGLQDWINSNPQTIKDLKGKVVLVDFWTYSCINCIRNNPYIESWYQTYKDDGFVAIGVHAPEFAFEKIKANVQKAVKDQKISYPVALDNDFATWNAYQNRSWPASYLIDAEGKVRRIHEGEGKYVEGEQAIRELLKEKGARVDNKMANTKDLVPVTQKQTPETYLGRQRASNYVGTPALGAAAQSNFVFANDLKANQWTLSGNWEVQQQKLVARGSSKLKILVSAKDVYLVGGSANQQAVGIKVNGKVLKSVIYDESKLYKLVSFPEFTETAILELSVPDGVELNAFTFGS
jgi:cytochrome c biogenesis protein CcdA/thiol-disulfide isomerase/thioredoxin